MYDFTVLMALVDFIPVAFFAVAACLLLKDTYGKLSGTGFVLLAAGTVEVFSAGFLKALWKLLYAAEVCNFEALNKLFLPTQSMGFLLAGIAMVMLVCGSGKKMRAVAPPVFSGTALFLVMMVAGLGCICVCLSILAARLKKKGAIVLFVLTFVASMGMGYAGRLDSTAAWVNWLEQSINIVSQLCLMCGVLMLHKAGLGKQ